MSDNQSSPIPAPPSGDVSAEERQWGMFAHLSALSALIIPLGNVLGPLIIWMMKKQEMPFVEDQGKEALNFQITVFIAIIICIPLMFILIGFLLFAIVGIGSLVLTIMAAMKANAGERYRYPFAFRLIK